jgi:hypothetical protein
MVAKPYFIKTKKANKLKLPGFPKAQKKVESPEEEEPIGLVQGQIPRSKEEWRVANALWRLQIPFQYQVDFMGGSNVRGGQVIDFLVGTVPLPTPLYVQGSYFHPQKTRAQEVYNQQKVRRFTRGSYAMPREVWDYELTNMNQAYQTIKAMF